MSVKIIKKIIIFILITMAMILLVQLPSQATNFSVSATKTSLTTGDSTTLVLKLVDGDGEFLIESSDPSVISIEANEAKPWLEGLGSEDSKTITLKAKKAGKVTIKVTATNVTTSQFTELEGSKSVTIEVKDPAPENNGGNTGGAELKSITVAGKTFNNPETDITVTVGADTRAAEIKAVAKDANAKITGTGSKDLITGTNTTVITVTAPNGATKKYTVRIRKLADTSGSQPNVEPTNTQRPDETPQDEVPQIEDLRLTYLRIEDVELIPEFNSEIFEYSVAVTNVDKLDIVAVQNVEGAEVTITGNSNLVEGDNEIIITVSKEGQDPVIYRITVTKTVEQIAPMITEEENKGMGGFLETTGGKVAVSIGGAGAVGVLAFIIHKIKSSVDMTSRTARRAAVRRSTFNDFDD